MLDDTYYITAAWSGGNVTRVPLNYIIGNESVTYADGMKYVNAKLSAGSTYTIFVWIDLKSDVPVRALYMSVLYSTLCCCIHIRNWSVSLLYFYIGRR